MKNTRQAQGFTLVEMAIVLVIIGLLVGAIAAASTYSRNAQLSNVMNEGKYYINAFNQFQAQYNGPPGDYCYTTTVCGTNAAQTVSAIWPTTNNGDGNGLIRAASTAFPRERYYAFQHLALAGLIKGVYTGVTNGGTDQAKIGVNVPGSSIDKTAFLFDHPDATDGFVSGDSLYFDGQYSNILRIAGLSDTATSIPDQGFLTPKQALRLDEKYDDGLPGQGNIVTPISTALANCASTAVATTATYVTNTDAASCYLILKMQ